MRWEIYEVFFELFYFNSSFRFEEFFILFGLVLDFFLYIRMEGRGIEGVRKLFMRD